MRRKAIYWGHLKTTASNNPGDLAALLGGGEDEFWRIAFPLLAQCLVDSIMLTE